MYEPKIEVVRASPMGRGGWNDEDGKWPDMERAYVVRGLPMPGEKVSNGIKVHTVASLEIDRGEILVRYDQGGVDRLCDVHPHDPEAERLRVATEAITEYWDWVDDDDAEDIARAVLDALKEVDDG